MRSAASRRQSLAEGARAEACVADALRADGWTLLARNWRTKAGELDIVASRAGFLRFVEVKAREPNAMVIEESITPKKQRKLEMAAEAWMLEHSGRWSEMAFLVALVNLQSDEIEWIDDAFDV